MKYDLSAKHQDKLISDTLARIRECRELSQQLEESHIARTEAIKQRSQAQQQEVARDVTRQKDGLESEHQQILVTAKETLETDVKLTKDELQQEVFAAKTRQAATQRR